MSLTSSIGMAGNALRVNNIALQVVGQNLSNANTPGYIRERIVLTAAPTQKYGGVMMGMGVYAKGVVQVIDEYVEQRLRTTTSELANSETQEQTYIDLESLMNELTEQDLSSSVNRFFNSISDVLNQPESLATRNLVALQGERLARDVNRLGEEVQQMRVDINGRIEEIASEINSLTEQIRELNVQIATTEGGDVSASDAVGLRDQRLQALTDLAKLIDIRVEEQPTSGGVAVYSGSNYLVFEGVQRDVEAVYTSEEGFSRAQIQLVDTDSIITCTEGEYNGQLTSRDVILEDFSTKLDDYIKTLIFEFNKIHASGQGLSGFNTLTSVIGVDDPTVALDAEELDLEYTPVNGSFDIIVRNKKTNLSETFNILVEMDRLDPEDNDSLDDLVAKIDAVDGISASVTLTGKLKIDADSTNLDFSFANDSSHVLSVLGVNTFFTGSTSRDMGVNQTLFSDPSKFAASENGIGADTANAVTMGELPSKELEDQNNETLLSLYKRLANETAEGSAIAKEQADADRVYQGTLEGQKLATSGVSIDEESIRLMSFQRAYQANAKYISTLADLLDVVINL